MERAKRRGARVGGQECLWEEGAMAVRAGPGDVYPVVGCLEARRCYGCGNIGSAMKFLSGGRMDARWASACVSKPAIRKCGVQGRDLETIWVRGDRCRRNHGKRGAMGI